MMPMVRKIGAVATVAMALTLTGRTTAGEISV
jgi:hypothetical protein